MSDDRRRQRIAAGALGVTVALGATKVAVGLATSSLALLSQALDSLIDVVAVGLVFLAVRYATKPADESHHYGHAKAENLVAFTQTLLLGAIAAGLFVEAVRRLGGDDITVKTPWYALALLVGSAAIDVVRTRWLMSAARELSSDALRAGAINFATDVGTALVALVSLLAVRSGTESADAIGALIVCAIVGILAFRLGKRSVDILMDRAPEARMRAIEAAAASAPGVSEARRVRVRETGNQLFADVTVAAGRTASLERAHDIAENVEREIARVAPGTDVVVHVEPASETSSLVERVQAAASRAEGVHEVHNVLVHAFDDAGTNKLHVTLHAKAAPRLSVTEAHDLADLIEAQVVTELGLGVRVDAHIEPLQQTMHGRVVTADRSDVVRAVEARATEEVEILDCHEVIVVETGESLTVVAHVRGRGDTSLAALHDAADRVEKAILAEHSEIGRVLIHFEPA
jgi:cation diffusion facilitator family transporter